MVIHLSDDSDSRVESVSAEHEAGLQNPETFPRARVLVTEDTARDTLRPDTVAGKNGYEAQDGVDDGEDAEDL